jgi:hypothetical protein
MSCRLTFRVLLGCAVLSVLTVAEATAQATRTWVSGVGDDANPCSRTAPCKSFAGAISKTAAGGEISVLDPGGFGAVTITKSITINGDGTLAGILNAGTNGVIVNAGAADRVVLRNLSINGVGTGLNGIRYLAGFALVVENVTINGVTTRGIDVAVASGGTLTVKNLTVTRAATGIRLTSTAGSIVATLDNVALNGLTTGLEVATNGFATLRNSTLTRNSTAVLVNASGANANVEGSLLSFNGTAVNASASGANIRLADNQIYTNTTGIAIAGGATVASAGGNRVAGNGGSTPPNASVPVQ